MQNLFRIIIAQEDAILASILTRLILRRYPATKIQAFGNGFDALAAYDDAGAELLFVNHHLPGMDGPTLVRTLRARGDCVPIVGMSGNPRLRDAYMATGAMVFVAGAELLTQLPTLLQRFLPPLSNDLLDLPMPRASEMHGD